MRHEPLVSITIPCYQQLNRARRAVESIVTQSCRDFELTLADDGSSDEYKAYVRTLGDSRVRYRRNSTRLGAMRNIFEAIGAGTATYTLAFHEDDLLGGDYLSAAVGILERHPECGFVAGEIREFFDEPDPAVFHRRVATPEYQVYRNGAELLHGIFRGIEPMFGSIVYRREAVEQIAPDLDRFGTLADRPFLLAILKRWSAAIIRDPLTWYRHHDAADGRHSSMRAEHVLNLFRTYRTTLPARLGDRDAALFFHYSSCWLATLHGLIPAVHRPSLRRFLFQAWRAGLYDPRPRGRVGYAQAIRAVLGVQAAGT